MRRVGIWIAASLVGVLSACAGGGLSEGPSGSASFERPSATSGTMLTQSFGNVELRLLNDALEKVMIGRYRFSLRRREQQSQTVYYETLWIPRPPTEEERARGIMEARHRVIVEGRRASGGPLTGTDVQYRVDLRVENEVRTRTQREWAPSRVFGEEIEQEMRRMVSDIQLEIRTGR